jgi:hypothetical protein
MTQYSKSAAKIGWCFIAVLWQVQLLQAESPKQTNGISVEWQVASDQVNDVKKAVPLKEAQAEGTRNPILIGAVVLIGVVALPQIAQAIVDVYYRYKSGGVVIDKEPILISTSDRIAPGYALVISKSENQVIEVGGVKPLKVEDLTSILKAALLK